MNVARFLDQDYVCTHLYIPPNIIQKYVYDEVKQVVDACLALDSNTIVKVILETSLLTESEDLIIDACIICVLGGAHFVKTSTGFYGEGAEAKTCALMKSVVGDEARVKASGGIRTKDQAMQFLSAGVSRIGTSSGVSIVQSHDNE
jgi:deoxyribose-phosphate aldolase